MARLAAFICQTPASLVTLVDSTRQWFLSEHGISATDTSREVAFCIHALVSPDLVIVPDTHADARFAANPPVTGEPFVRFYAGAPLSRPTAHVWGRSASWTMSLGPSSADQADALHALSRPATAQLERHRLKRELHA